MKHPSLAPVTDQVKVRAGENKIRRGIQTVHDKHYNEHSAWSESLVGVVNNWTGSRNMAVVMAANTSLTSFYGAPMRYFALCAIIAVFENYFRFIENRK